MPHNKEIRLLLSLRAIELLEIISLVAFEHKGFGRNPSDIMIVLATAVGMYENKPMTAAKIAQYIGMPRPTVIRRVGLLVKSGKLSLNFKKQILFSEELESRAENIMPVLKKSRILRNVTYMSKMDS